MSQLRKMSLVLGLFLISGVTLADPGGRSFSAPSRARSNIHIPKACVIKAQTLINSVAMSVGDRSVSQAFLNVLSSVGSTIAIDYVLTPHLVQQDRGIKDNQGSSRGNGRANASESNAQPTTEISIKGYLGSVQVVLVQASGSSYATAQVFNSPAEAQASASATVASNLIQTTSNQATVNLDVIATSIQSLRNTISVSSDLQSQSSLTLTGGAAVTGDPSTGLPTALAHALTLADIISHIDVKAEVTFDGNTLVVSSPQTSIGC